MWIYRAAPGANTVESTCYGIWVDYAGSAIVRRTRFQWNAVLNVYVVENAWADLGNEEQWGENAFYLPEEGGYHVYNENEDYIDALYCFWDPLDEEFIYKARFEPWLERDPLESARREVPGNQTLASDLEFAQAFPNPFNPSTTIRLNLLTSRDITISIYNILGQGVRKLYSGPVSAGVSDLVWDGRNEAREEVAAGIYLVQIKGLEISKTVKITVLK